MTEPWFNPNQFGAWFGAIVGGGGGTLFGLLGALMGIFLPRGRGMGLVHFTLALGVFIGLACLGFGIIALVSDQPYGIWYPPLLCGFVFTFLSANLFFVIRGVRGALERRKMEARDLRDL